jgi:hypothetical protein
MMGKGRENIQILVTSLVMLVKHVNSIRLRHYPGTSKFRIIRWANITGPGVFPSSLAIES